MPADTTPCPCPRSWLMGIEFLTFVNPAAPPPTKSGFENLEDEM